MGTGVRIGGAGPQTERLDALAGLVDLRSIPFTEPFGRMTVFLEGADTIRVSSAEYEQPPEACGSLRALRFLDGSGRALPITARTRPDRVDLEVGGQSASLVFAEPDTLVLRLPVEGARLLIQTRADARTWRAAPAGGAAGSGTVIDEGRLQRLGYRIVGDVRVHDAAADHEGRLEVSASVAGGDDAALVLSWDGAGGAPDAPPAGLDVRTTERWAARLGSVPLPAGRSAEPSLRAAWVLAANTLHLRSHPSRRAVVPSKMGYVAVWQWDACFHAIGLRHIDPGLAREQLLLALAAQLSDGMLPDVLHDTGVLAASSDMVGADQERSLLHIGRRDESRPRRLLQAPVTKPPLTALTAWKLFQVDGDRAFLADVYPAIARSQRWWFDHSRPRGRALPIYLHPYSSGVDDSPLWDLGWPVATPDLPAYLALQADHLARIAEVVGRAAEADVWRIQAEATTSRLVARSWRPRRGAFSTRRGRREVRSDTVIGLLPLITGRLSGEVARRVVASLTDPDRFWPAHPVPSVALSDPDFDRSVMWRGPTWLFMDFLFVDGLRRSGFHDEAERLRERALGLVEGGHGMSEYYDPLDGSRPPRASAMFSGTAALYVDLLLGDPG